MLKKQFSILTPYASVFRSLLGLHSGHERYWELDLIRGIAIIVMISYHLSWDLQYFNLIPSEFFIQYIRPIFNLAAVFIVLVGVSLTISYRRTRIKTEQTNLTIFKKYLIRGLFIFGLGMVITLVALVFTGGGIDFGILHLLGFSIIVAFPLLRFRWLNLILGAVIILAGYFYVSQVTFEARWLVWLGFKPSFYSSQDYFPIFPWFGWVLIGLFLGNLLYSPPEARKFKIPDISNWVVLKPFILIGRSALFIYLIHQPILFPTIYIISLIV